MGHDDDPFFRFPGGEIHMKHDPETYTGKEIALITGRVDIEDLMKLQMWAEVVCSQGGDANAVIPYLPAARADRGIPSSGELYANMINAADLKKVICFDPHSAAAARFYTNLNVVMPDIIADHFARSLYTGVIAPDVGASERAEIIADVLEVPIYYAGKTRDFQTGGLTGFVSPDGIDYGGSYLIVDDICDGGGTFNGLADQMKADGFNGKLDLYVSHGIFSKGLDELANRFRTIYTADTWTKQQRRGGVVIPVLGKLLERV